jgi:hypothetical protein
VRGFVLSPVGHLITPVRRQGQIVLRA